MVNHHLAPVSRAWRDAFGPGFVSGPSEKTLWAVSAAERTYRSNR